MYGLPQTENLATAAAYFLYGLEAGIFPDDCAKEWAYSIVAAEETPPIEIIEVAAANRREDVFASLGAVAKQGADLAETGSWLLAQISRSLRAGNCTVHEALRRALHVAQATGLPSSVYYEFDALSDELILAERGEYSTVEAATAEVVSALEKHESGKA